MGDIIDRYERIAAEFAGRAYVVTPGPHAGHVVRVVEADPRDEVALRAQCSCGETWALGLDYVERAFEQHTEIDPEPDPRGMPITITLTAREWDAIAFDDSDDDRRDRWRSYARRDNSLNSRVLYAIGRATRDGLEGRFELAKADAEALRPDVMVALDAWEERVRLLVEWWENGDKAGVSHLGAGAPWQHEIVEGLKPWILPGRPVIGLRLPETSFAGKYPYLRFTEEEAAALRERFERVRPIDHSWNDTTNCISIEFVPQKGAS